VWRNKEGRRAATASMWGKENDETDTRRTRKKNSLLFTTTRIGFEVGRKAKEERREKMWGSLSEREENFEVASREKKGPLFPPLQQQKG